MTGVRAMGFSSKNFLYLLICSVGTHAKLFRTRFKLDRKIPAQGNQLLNTITQGLAGVEERAEIFFNESVKKVGDAVLDKIPIVETIVQTQKWKYTHIIAPEEFIFTIHSELLVDDCILDYISPKETDNQLRRLLQDVVTMETIEQQSNIMNFVVIDGADQINNIMQQAKALDKEHGVGSLFRHFSKWLLIPLGGPLSLRTDFDNVAIVQELDMETQKRNVTEMLPVVVKRHQQCLQLELSHCHVQLSQMMARFIEVHAAEISTMLWKNNGRALSQVATVNNSGTIKWNADLFPNEKFGLNGRKLRLSIKEWIPLVFKRYDDNGVIYEGVCPDVIKDLSHAFNFTYYYTEPKDGQWGQMDGQNWTGIIGDVHNEIVDMSGTWLGNDYHRSQSVDFSVTMYLGSHTIVYIPPPEEYPLTFLVRQFKTEVYICGFGVFVSVLILFAFIGLVHPKKSTCNLLNKSCFNYTGELTLMLTASALHQGIIKAPSTDAGRMLLAYWWLYTLIVTAIYCGNLIAYEAVTKDIKPFHSLSEILEREDFIFGIEGNTLMVNTLKLTHDPELKRLWNRLATAIESDPTVIDPDPCIHFNRLLEGNYAYIIEGISLHSFKGNNCRIMNLNTAADFMPTSYSFAFPKNSPLPKLFKSELMMFVDNGMREMMFKKWLKPEECEETKNIAKPMKIQDYAGVVIAAALGITVASMVLLVEYVCGNIKFKTATAGEMS